jgi:hypothetical protein
MFGKFKKFLIQGIFVLVLVLIINTVQVSAAYTPSTGDLIKTDADSAVYYIDTDNKRHLFVNSVTFWSWYTGSWSNIRYNDTPKTIRIISQSDFDNIEVGSNITARPGVKIIKFPNSPKMYSVISNHRLASIDNTDIAKSLYGDNWNSKVITIQNGFENDYTKNGELNTNDNNLWSIINQLAEANQNYDSSWYNYLSYEPVESDELERNKELTDWSYQEILKLKETDYNIHLNDGEKQAIYFTDWIRTETDDSNGYNRKSIIFVKNNSIWKILSIGSQGYSALKSQGSEGESDLQSMIIDTDNDGLTDWNETCSGAGAYNPDCIETNPNNKDTDGDGWWDSIDDSFND